MHLKYDHQFQLCNDTKSNFVTKKHIHFTIITIAVSGITVDKEYVNLLK